MQVTLVKLCPCIYSGLGKPFIFVTFFWHSRSFLLQTFMQNRFCAATCSSQQGTKGEIALLVAGAGGATFGAASWGDSCLTLFLGSCHQKLQHTDENNCRVPLRRNLLALVFPPWMNRHEWDSQKRKGLGSSQVQQGDLGHGGIQELCLVDGRWRPAELLPPAQMELAWERCARGDLRRMLRLGWFALLVACELGCAEQAWDCLPCPSLCQLDTNLVPELDSKGKVNFCLTGPSAALVLLASEEPAHLRVRLLAHQLGCRDAWIRAGQAKLWMPGGQHRGGRRRKQGSRRSDLASVHSLKSRSCLSGIWN